MERTHIYLTVWRYNPGVMSAPDSNLGVMSVPDSNSIFYELGYVKNR